jgi:hypothetical protein
MILTTLYLVSAENTDILDESIDNKKHKVLSSNPKRHEAQLEDQKSQEKAQESHLEEGKATRPTKGMKSGKPGERAKKSTKSKQSDQEDLKIK